MDAITNNRTFGVEIEAIGNRRRVFEALELNGIPAWLVGWSEHHRNDRSRRWKITTDASLGDEGVEVVSPVLRGEAGLAQVKQVAKIMEDAGCTINRRCGLHVHIDASNIELLGFKRIAKVWWKFENIVDAWMPHSRRKNNARYCQSNKARYRTMDAAYRAVDQAEDLRQLGNVVNPDGRYYKLNYQAYWAHETIEYRCHSGTVEGTKITNWIRFCMAFTERIPSVKVRGNGKTYSHANEFRALFSWLKLDKEIVDFYKDRTKKLSPTALRRTRQGS